MLIIHPRLEQRSICGFPRPGLSAPSIVGSVWETPATCATSPISIELSALWGSVGVIVFTAIVMLLLASRTLAAESKIVGALTVEETCLVQADTSLIRLVPARGM